MNNKSETITWTHTSGDEYHVTGTDFKGKRFKQVYDNPYIALSVNVYNGSVWLVRNGKRTLLKKVLQLMRDEDYDNAVREYMLGYCACLAVALHYRYGFPLAASFVTNTSSKEEYLLHAWVMLPNGKHLDIEGEKSLQEMTMLTRDNSKTCTYETHLNLSLADLEKLTGVKFSADDFRIRRALSKSDQYLKKELEAHMVKVMRTDRDGVTTHVCSCATRGLAIEEMVLLARAEACTLPNSPHIDQSGPDEVSVYIGLYKQVTFFCETPLRAEMIAVGNSILE